MGRAPCCDKDGVKKGPWTPEEDQILVDYISKHGHGSWRSLPKLAGIYIYIAYSLPSLLISNHISTTMPSIWRSYVTPRYTDYKLVVVMLYVHRFRWIKTRWSWNEQVCSGAERAAVSDGPTTSDQTLREVPSPKKKRRPSSNSMPSLVIGINYIRISYFWLTVQLGLYFTNF